MSKAYRVLEDGTRVYSNGVKYKPLTPDERKYDVRKPSDPRAIRWRGDWFVIADLLESEARKMPPTRPDEQAYEHHLVKERCGCEVCRRTAAKKWRRRGRRERRRASVDVDAHNTVASD